MKTEEVTKRDYSFCKTNHQNKKKINGINLETGGELFFNSLYSVNQDLRINPGLIKMNIEVSNNVKTFILKKTGKRYRFKYIDLLPDKYLKSANIKPKRVTAQEKENNQKAASERWLNYS